MLYFLHKNLNNIDKKYISIISKLEVDYIINLIPTFIKHHNATQIKIVTHSGTLISKYLLPYLHRHIITMDTLNYKHSTIVCPIHHLQYAITIIGNRHTYHFRGFAKRCALTSTMQIFFISVCFYYCRLPPVCYSEIKPSELFNKRVTLFFYLIILIVVRSLVYDFTDKRKVSWRLHSKSTRMVQSSHFGYIISYPSNHTHLYKVQR